MQQISLASLNVTLFFIEIRAWVFNYDQEATTLFLYVKVIIQTFYFRRYTILTGENQ
jgi:hypothetical protein